MDYFYPSHEGVHFNTIAVVYDINGRLLESVKITTSSQQVNLSRYTNGVYFIKLNNKEVLKIVKQ
ncbi:MAG: T9SS type A sorting domain-containing protein [Ferruginibacter sp.]|nr:T9SS type A sorting domain-containing protein [Bacteroidota bacterium]MBX2918211.1 T9SS type A sorting domain-containing protein [Ferruginibacter sp.]MCC7378749.1 T9SS type A sorting domain-containing protein [Chitinophagaceae bacterium]